jgi:hypothetical protein
VKFHRFSGQFTSRYNRITAALPVTGDIPPLQLKDTATGGANRLEERKRFIRHTHPASVFTPGKKPSVFPASPLIGTHTGTGQPDFYKRIKSLS